MSEQFSRFDVADYLTNEEEIAAYLDAVMEEGDPNLLAAALGDIARARGVTELSRQTGISREGIYKALSGTGNPAMATIMKITSALGLRLAILPRGSC